MASSSFYEKDGHFFNLKKVSYERTTCGLWYRLSQNFNHTLKYHNKMVNKNIWNNRTWHIQTLISIRNSWNIIMLSSGLFNLINSLLLKNKLCLKILGKLSKF